MQTNAGWIFYDGRCGICVRQAGGWTKTFQERGFHFAPLQTEWVRLKLGLPQGEIGDEMKVLTPDGCVKGGLDALIYLASLLWWARPIASLAQLPGIYHVCRTVYRQVAKRRYCIDGVCELHKL